jgi:hypothetical protein
MTKWLPFAAAPTFALMALVTAASDSSAPMALCSGAGSFGLSGMTPMYVLMAAFHLGPWLKLASRQGGMTLFWALDRPSNIRSTEQKR